VLLFVVTTKQDGRLNRTDGAIPRVFSPTPAPNSDGTSVSRPVFVEQQQQQQQQNAVPPPPPAPPAPRLYNKKKEKKTLKTSLVLLLRHRHHRLLELRHHHHPFQKVAFLVVLLFC
jgi:hypothetical protein